MKVRFPFLMLRFGIKDLLGKIHIGTIKTLQRRYVRYKLRKNRSCDIENQLMKLLKKLLMTPKIKFSKF